MDNYEYCAAWAKGRGRVLDYGCGAGQTVSLLRRAGTEAFGCDVFYEGGDYRAADRGNGFHMHEARAT